MVANNLGIGAWLFMGVFDIIAGLQCAAGSVLNFIINAKYVCFMCAFRMFLDYVYMLVLFWEPI
jgi:hypothetical protein